MSVTKYMDRWSDGLFIFILMFSLFLFLFNMQLMANTITEGLISK